MMISQELYAAVLKLMDEAERTALYVEDTYGSTPTHLMSALDAIKPLVKAEKPVKNNGWRGKPILCLDFDGVCHSYSSGWQGVAKIPDKPVDGLFPFLLEAMRHFTIMVYSSRSNWPEGVKAMKAWFALYWQEWLNTLPQSVKGGYAMLNLWEIIEFPDHKPPAAVGIDDRVLTFTGEWPAVENLINFKSWTKGQDQLADYNDLLNGEK